MKLITSFFSSSSSSSNNKSSSNKSKSKKSKGRSMNRSDTPSFGSSTTTSSNDSFSRATVRTPTTVFLGRNASALDAEYWSSTSADFASKAAGVGGGSSSGVVSSAVSDLFCVFDRDGDGKITKQELEVVLRRLRRSDPPTEEEVVMMMAEVDRDGDGCISLEEFGVLGTALVDPAAASGGVAAAAAAGAAVEEELRDAFGIFDEDGDGKISAEELLQVFLALGDERCTLEECRRMIGGVDSDGDGYVCFDDFFRMMDGQRL